MKIGAATSFVEHLQGDIHAATAGVAWRGRARTDVVKGISQLEGRAIRHVADDDNQPGARRRCSFSGLKCQAINSISAENRSCVQSVGVAESDCARATDLSPTGGQWWR